MKKILCAAMMALFLTAFAKTKAHSTINLAPSTGLTDPMAVDSTGARQFWEALKLHCGKAFEGTVVSGGAEDFKGKRLVMHLLSCSEDEILIPFNVGDNRSRTWILKFKNDRIELKHDHRHEDGSPDKISMYGGTTTNSGLPTMAVFPADQQTLDLIPAAGTNVWWITIDGAKYTYNLRRIGSDRFFSVAFDLGSPIEIPAPSWGWEDYVVPR